MSLLLSVSLLSCALVTCFDSFAMAKKEIDDEFQRNLTTMFTGFNRKLNSLEKGMQRVEDHLDIQRQDLNKTINIITQDIAGKLEDLKEVLLANISGMVGPSQENLTQAQNNTSICPEETVSCPEEWVPFRDSCYYLSNYHFTWSSALQYCTYLESQLLTITDFEEWRFTSGLTENSHWIGLNDIGSEGNYTWISDGTPLSFARWASGHPRDPMRINDCVLSNGLNLWYATQCGTRNQFICEKKLSSS